jgi:peptidoglycan/LPS O-acetylase OafA/YrhL
VGEARSDNIADDALRVVRRRVCALIAAAGLIFAISVIVNNPMVVGILGGVPTFAASGFAVGSLVAVKRHQAVERAWLAVGLLAFGVVLVILVNLIW